MKILFMVLILLLVLTGCRQPGNQKDAESFEEAQNLMNMPAVPDTVINNILQQIPSPLEMSALIKESGARYDKSHLNNPESYSKYNNSYSRALNLGIFGADLGYSNLYDENQQCILYVGAIKELSDELRIDQFFNFKLIEKLADERNLDSLLLISTQSFNEVNDFFQSEQRSGLSVLMLIGGWVEALHISCQVSMRTPNNAALLEKIGEQKIVLGSILRLVSYYKDSDANFNKLHGMLSDLSAGYERIQIEQSYSEPTLTEENGVLVTRDNSRMDIHMDSQTFDLIKNKVFEIRNMIVS